MNQPRVEITACAFWVAALSLMGFGTIDSMRDNHTSPFLAWGLFCAIVACVPTGWAILCRVHEGEDTSVEHIIEVVDALHQGKGELTRLR